MEVFEKLNKLVEEKEKEELSDQDRDTLEVVKLMLDNKQVLFYSSADAILGMLDFLGVPENELNKYFFEIISPETHKEAFPKERVGISL